MVSRWTPTSLDRSAAHDHAPEEGILRRSMNESLRRAGGTLGRGHRPDYTSDPWVGPLSTVLEKLSHTDLLGHRPRNQHIRRDCEGYLGGASLDLASSFGQGSSVVLLDWDPPGDFDAA
jgi:hypothetical protein